MIDHQLGNGTKTSKIHWMLHIPYYIRMHGPPKAYSGQTPEHCLSPFVKWAARMTQLRPSTLIQQSCERYYENHVIDRAFEILRHQNVVPFPKENNQITLQLQENLHSGSIMSYVVIGRYQILFDDNLKFTKIVWKHHSSKNKNKYIQPNVTIINDLITRMHTNEFGLQSKHIDCFTTLHTMRNDTKQKDMYRADSYFYKRPWNDWCETRWEAGSNTGCYPSRLLMFIDTSNMTFDNFENQQHPYLALIRASEPDERSIVLKKNKNCMLVNSFESDKFIRIINCGTITKPIFVIPDVNDVITQNNKTKFKSEHRLELKDKKTWPELFLSMPWM